MRPQRKKHISDYNLVSSVVSQMKIELCDRERVWETQTHMYFFSEIEVDWNSEIKSEHFVY